MSGVLQNIDRYEVVFDDESLVADAGLLAAGTLMDRLGLEDVVDRTVRLEGRVGGANPGRKVCTLVAAMLVGGSHIDHVGRLRAGSTDRVLPHAVMAPSTVGTFLRSFTWGHVRQLEKVVTLTLGRAWRAGAGPGKGPVTVDLDSTICAVSGKTKQGAAFGYTKVLGYHPLLAFRADTGEVVGARLRAGGSQRGVVHFVGETIRRVRRAGARGPVSVRADSGFWSYAMLAALDHLGVGWSITTQVNAKVRAQITHIDEDAWAPIVYPRGGEAQVGETVLEMTNPKKRSQKRRVRLVVRRTRLVGSQAQLFPDWRYHTLVTNLDLAAAEADRHHQPRAVQDDTGHQPRRGEQDTEVAELSAVEIGDNPGEAHSPLPAVEADRYHRRHATCELAIRDLKDSGGLAHLPSGVFAANAAWLICAALAHNLYRHIALLGGTRPRGRLVCGRTIRTRLFGVPGRVVNHGGRRLLRLPARWPWAGTYLTTLTNLRTLPQLC